MHKDIKKELLEYFDKLLKETPKIPSLPDAKPPELYKINIEYPLIPLFAYANIYYDLVNDELVYNVIEPVLERDEELLIKHIKEEIINKIYQDVDNLTDKDKEEILLDLLLSTIKRYKIKYNKESLLKIFYYLWRDMIGLEKVEPLMHDPFIEDISCDGYDIPIYVNHRKYGILRTNISFTKNELERFVIKLAQKSGKYISYAEPLLDATLPDGSRINATYSSDVTTRGPTFTIRKFRKEIMSIIDLIKNNTLSIDIAAYFWWAIENRANVIIAGETASGKTTLLNAIAMFIPPNAKIVSIEDTREIQLYHENWIPALTREGFYIEGKKYGEITMYDLLKESFRQNPDYIIVGEVRGQEAYVMFQGMASGHAALTTMHADSIQSIIRRLTTPPINLPKDLLELLDVAVFMVRARNISPSARRVREVVEVGKMSGDHLEISKIFVWNPVQDSFELVNRSVLTQELEQRVGSIKDFEEDLEKKSKVLNYLLKRNIRDPKKVSQYIRAYYLDKDALLEEIEENVD